MKVFMYTLSTCPWCRKTKQFFKDMNIPFDYVDYDLKEGDEQEKIMEELSRISGSNAFPVVVIGEEIGEDVVIGYNPEKYTQLLEKYSKLSGQSKQVKKGKQK